MTDLGIAVIDAVFALALLAVASCLAYLVSVTLREHDARSASEPRASIAAEPTHVAPSGARVVSMPSLRPSIARHRNAASS